MKKKLLSLFAALALAATVSAQVGYTYDSASNDNFQKAFDGNTSTKFEGSNLAGNWMIIKTADEQPHVVQSYAITTHDDGSYGNRAPKTWTLEGSNDKTNWTLVDKVINDPIENKNYTTFTFDDHYNFNAYTYLRFTMLTMKGTGWTQIGEFAVTAVAEADIESFRAAKKEYFINTKLPEVQAEVANFNTALGEDDPWTQEFGNVVSSLPDVFNSTTDFSYEEFSKAYDLMLMRDQFTGKVYPFGGSTTNCWGDGHWSQLIDGNTSTKWGGNFSGNEGDANHVQYVIFRTKEALQPYFYKLVTGNDTKTNKGRNWRDWQVYGGNFSSIDAITMDAAGWVLLDNREDISETYLPMENYYPAMLNFTEGVAESYYYYMVKVTKAHEGTQIQMSEMSLHTQAEFEDMRAPFVDEFKEFAAELDAMVVESEHEADKATFTTKYNSLKTTDDAVQLTLLYNECVALRKTLILSALMNLKVDDVVQIGTVADLKYFSEAVNAGSINLDAALTADIDMTGISMNPIGENSSRYTGTFDGKGYTIANYTCEDANVARKSLFGVTQGATIQNILLKNARIVGNENIGGIVGMIYGGTVKNCAVVDSYIEGRDHVGAIAGEIRDNATIQNCYSDAEIYSRGYQAGGLAGTSRGGSFLNNLFLGSINCAGGSVGGVVALIDAEDNSVKTTIQKNVVAATSINLGWGDDYFFYLTNINGKSPEISDNYVLTTTKFREDKTLADVTGGNQGTAVSDVKAITFKNFYAKALGWNMTNDWNFYAAGYFPVLAWMDVEVPVQSVTVTDAGYATIIAAGELAPAAETVFIAQNKGEYVHLEPVTKVPAGAAVVVKGEGTVEIPYAVEYAAAFEDNDLVAATEDVTADGTQYILANGTEGVGFYKATENTTIAAGKGYLVINGDAGIKGFYGIEFNDATGIETVQQTTDNSPIYNVAGQRLSKMQKGINIVAGKKVLK